MKYAKLVHNPKAGERAHSKKSLIQLIEKAGYMCSYSSTKRGGWELLNDKMDFVISAGGDGTVRKIIGELLKRRLFDKQFPLALLPFGTANNIGKTLGLPDTVEKIIARWDNEELKRYDVGKIYNLKEAGFFLESFGFGVFPALINEMRKSKHEMPTPEEEIIHALEVLHEIILTYPAKACHITIDGKEHAGNFLLCEIMNTRSVGPNLLLSPDGDPGDGEFEVVLIAEQQRSKLAKYVENKLKNKEKETSFPVLKARKVTIRREQTLFHADDLLIETKKMKEIKIEMYPGVLKFLV